MGVIEVIDKISEYITKTGYRVALEVGARNLKMILIEFEALKVKLVNFRIKEIPVLVPDQKNNFVIEELRKFLGEHNVDFADVYISQTENVFLKRITLPDMPQKEIASAIRWNIREELPFGVDNALIGYEIVGATTAGDGSKAVDVVVAAAKKDDIYERINLLMSNNLRVVNVTTVISNVRNMIRHAKNIDQTKSVIILDIGFKQSIISIVKDKRVVYARAMPFGSNDITESLMQSVAESKNVVTLSYEEAEEIKTEKGLPLTKSDTSKVKGIDADKIRALIRPVMEGVIGDIKRSINFYKSRYDNELEFDKLYLIGGGANVKNLDKFLKENLSVEVDYCEPVFDINVEHGEGVKCEKETSQLCPLMAMLISASKTGDLLPIEFKAYKYELLEHLLVKVMAFTTIAFMVLSFLTVNLKLDAYRRRLKTVQIHWQTIQTVKNYNDKIGVLSGLVSTIRSPYVSEISLLKLLSNFTPGNVVLDRVQYDKQNESIKIAGAMFIKRDRAANALADFVNQMEVTPLLSDVNLAWSRQRGTDENPTVEFEIRAKVAYEGKR